VLNIFTEYFCTDANYECMISLDAFFKEYLKCDYMNEKLRVEVNRDTFKMWVR
jgi:hypothetical protein